MGERGLGLVDLWVSMAVFSFLVIGVIAAQWYAMRQDQLVNSELGSSDNSRMSFDKLTTEIRSAKIWRVGSGGFNAFTPCSNGATQQGNALQLNLTVATNTYIQYYFDTNRSQLCRFHSGDATNKVLASHLTNDYRNSMTFMAEKYDGTPVTDLQYSYVVHAFMDFCQYQYPLTPVGPGWYYNFYRINIRATPHCPD